MSTLMPLYPIYVTSGARRRTTRHRRYIDPFTIRLLSGASGYTILHFRSSSYQQTTAGQHLASRPLTYHESILTSGGMSPFFRIHKQTIINLLCVEGLLRYGPYGLVELDNYQTYPVARRRWQELIDRMEAMRAWGWPLASPTPRKITQWPAGAKAENH